MSTQLLDEDDAPRALWERVAGLLIVLGCTLVVFTIMNPRMHVWPVWHPQFGDLFTNTTTNGGDMGAHVYWPWFLEHNWFTKFRLSGWSPDWYAGFPIGQYYFPLPALLVALFDLFIPYNVAFKLVTALGPLLLPAGAYYFARGMRAPWPAPPAFAIAGLGLLVETRNDWQIYGGNIASTLAGEFSFTLGLALGLFALGALAHTLDTGKRAWLPAVLLAATVMSHVVVAIIIGVLAALLWLTRRPFRTWKLAGIVAFVAGALTAVWSVPLIAQQGYTQSMRYTKKQPEGDFTLWGPLRWLLPGPVEHTIQGIGRGLGQARDSTGKVLPPTLWLPLWIWALAAVAIVAAGWYRRRSTLVLLLMAGIVGVMFIQWPEHAVWNTRFLPFWLLMWGFLAAMGATEIARVIARGSRFAYNWVREGDLHDARAGAWLDILRADPATVPPELREQAGLALTERRFSDAPPGWEPPPRLQPRAMAARRHLVETIVLALLVLIVGTVCVHRAWGARDNNPGIAIRGWAGWNYSGYESRGTAPGKRDTWAEYNGIMEAMNTLPAGRALWEPSSMEGDPINAYGTSLALELLPYFTKGRIGSMEGIYFESSTTTSIHFLTVAEVAKHPSNPVRGLDYGNLDTNFDLGVEHLQMLGVRYLMLWTPEAQAKAVANRDLRLVKTIPDRDNQDPKGWKVWEVRDSALVEPLSVQPVVAKSVKAGTTSECFGLPKPQLIPGEPEPRLGAWECEAAPWWRQGALLDRPWTASGPKEWKRVDLAQLSRAPRVQLPKVEVSKIVEDVDKISFHVSRPGVPVMVKTSFYPNWHVKGAKGVYRAAPNLMVVIPTERDVTLTYGLTPVDWLGRLLTLTGIAGVVFLVRWRGARRYAAEEDPDGHALDEDLDEFGPRDATALSGDREGEGTGTGPDEDDPPPPPRETPAPALP